MRRKQNLLHSTGYVRFHIGDFFRIVATWDVHLRKLGYTSVCESMIVTKSRYQENYDKYYAVGEIRIASFNSKR